MWIGLLSGFVAGVLLGPICRVLAIVLHGQAGEQIDILSKERREMMLRDQNGV